MHVDYDSWKLAGPPEADQENLTDISCDRCDWDGQVFAHVAGSIIGWVCPKCDYLVREHVSEFFDQSDDSREEA